MPYPLPFHPLELGDEDALRALLGFALEGRPDPDDVDARRIELLGFRITDPDAAAREAELLQVAARMGRRRSLRLQPDGTWA